MLSWLDHNAALFFSAHSFKAKNNVFLFHRPAFAGPVVRSLVHVSNHTYLYFWSSSPLNATELKFTLYTVDTGSPPAVASRDYSLQLSSRPIPSAAALSRAEIVGIAVAAVALLALCVGALFLLVRRRRRRAERRAKRTASYASSTFPMLGKAPPSNAYVASGDVQFVESAELPGSTTGWGPAAEESGQLPSARVSVSYLTVWFDNKDEARK